MSRYILPVTSILRNSSLDDNTKSNLKTFRNIYEKDLSCMEEIHIIDFVKKSESIKEFNSSYSCSQFDNFLSAPVLVVDDLFNIYTGKYIGVLYSGKNTITIDTGYHPGLLFRMLDVVNDIYVERGYSDKLLYNKDALPRIIVEYLFVTSLNKLLMNGIPREYRKNSYIGSNIRGKINISKYINVEMQRSANFTQSITDLQPVQEICDVICQALKLTKSVDIDGYAKVKNIFVSLRSDKIVTKERIKKAKQHKILFNPMYSGYKQVLRYAEIIINNYNAITDDKSNNCKNISGFLIDIAKLWELYLEKLLKMNLHGWEVIPQPLYDICSKSFFKRTIRPDFVFRNIDTGKIAVLDAKFKTMTFENHDVDRSDLYQIAYYSSYFNSLQKDQFKTVSFLVYPLSQQKSNKFCCNSMLFNDNLDKVDQWICIDGIFVGEKSKELKKYENSKKTQNLPRATHEYLEGYNIFIEEQKFISSIITSLE